MLNIRQTSKIFLFYAISEGKIRNLGPVSKIGTFLGSFLDFGTNREIWDLIGSTECRQLSTSAPENKHRYFVDAY